MWRYRRGDAAAAEVWSCEAEETGTVAEDGWDWAAAGEPAESEHPTDGRKMPAPKRAES